MSNEALVEYTLNQTQSPIPMRLVTVSPVDAAAYSITRRRPSVSSCPIFIHILVDLHAKKCIKSHIHSTTHLTKHETYFCRPSSTAIFSVCNKTTHLGALSSIVRLPRVRENTWKCHHCHRAHITRPPIEQRAVCWFFSRFLVWEIRVILRAQLK